ncbi:MAG: tetratricopeptide repeat protein [Rhizobiales bacterium]|nr:tetratricopeptide repeat protein [Hyphomicrobiales bacterium]
MKSMPDSRLLPLLWALSLLVAMLFAAPAYPQDYSIPSLLSQARSGNVEAMTLLGDAYRLGQGVDPSPAEALRWYEQAAAAGDGYGLFYMGMLLKDRQQPGDLDRAMKAFERVLPIYRKALGPNHPQLALVYNQIGIVEGIRNNFAGALAAYRKGYVIRRKALGQRNVETAGMLNNIGNALQSLGKLDEARKAYREVLAIYGENDVDLSITLMNLGALERKSGNFAAAHDLYRQALRLRLQQKPRDPAALGDIHYNIGFMELELGLIDDALAAEDEALQHYREAFGNDHPMVATVQNIRAGLLERMGRIDEALAAVRQALAIREASFGPDHPETATSRSNLAVVLAAAGETEEALAEDHKALAQYEKLYGPANPEAARVLQNIAALEYDRGRMEESLAQAVKSIAIRSADTSLDATPASYAILANLMMKQENPVGARLFSKLIINAAQGLREAVDADATLSARVDQSFTAPFDYLTDQLTAEGAFSEAQFVASLLKTRELADYTRGGAKPSSSLARVKLLPSEEKLARSFTALFAPAHTLIRRIRSELRKKPGTERDRKLRSLEADLDKAYAKLAADVASLFASAEQARRAGQAERLALNARYADELAKELARFGGGVALYQAIATDRALHLFVTAPGRETIHREVSIARGDLARMVRGTVASVETRAADADDRLARLHELLIAPVSADLIAANPRVLMLNLSGFLRYVPYAALKSEHGYLVEDYALALYTPGADPALVQPDPPSAAAAGFGVSMAHESFPPLPGVARELESIFTGADAIGPLDGKPRLDKAFDAPALKAALRDKPRYLHIASHFRFLPGNESKSFLLLGTGEHLGLGQLRADPELRFAGVDLLTLSACETARGGGAEGEEIESFGALAQHNGASAVLATLWQIADESTATLMADFYHGRVAGGLDKATALQRAQIAMITGKPATEIASRGERSMTLVEGAEPAGDTASPTSHPYYWSAFILMGDWR